MRLLIAGLLVQVQSGEQSKACDQHFRRSRRTAPGLMETSDHRSMEAMAAPRKYADELREGRSASRSTWSTGRRGRASRPRASGSVRREPRSLRAPTTPHGPDRPRRVPAAMRSSRLTSSGARGQPQRLRRSQGLARPQPRGRLRRPLPGGAAHARVGVGRRGARQGHAHHRARRRRRALGDLVDGRSPPRCRTECRWPT